MNISTLDFETYFDDVYSLKKMTTEAYIRDPRFEPLMMAIRGFNKTEWIPQEYIREALLDYNVEKSAVLCHHAQFDGLILSHHYGVKPRAWLDTLSMARLVLGNHLSVSLGALADHYGLQAKSVPYELFKGKRWADLSPAVRDELGRGACHDVDLTWDIFTRLAQGFPAAEYQTIDTTIRMFTEPTAIGDTQQLAKVWADEAKRKQMLLAELGITAKDLQSADKFAALLRAEGVEPETKPGTAGPIYAFAKSDPFIKGLLEHDNPRVVSLVEARLGVKSTILQTRAERMGYMTARGPLCIYLSAYGAHTTRWAGGDKLNFQNPPPALKKAICAPPGHKLAIVDASQIECRILNMVAGQHDVIENFRNGNDPYVGVASEFYKRPINKKDHPEERQVGKVLELQCGFGSGGPKIKATLRHRANILLTDDEAMRARDAYRDTHPRVVDYWRQADMVLKRMSNLLSFDWGPLQVQCNIEKGTRHIGLPGCARINYSTLEWHVDETDSYWRIRTRDGYRKMYGAKLAENVVQYMARMHTAQAMNRIKAQGIRIVTMTHDDIVACLPDDDVIQDKFEMIKREMKQAPGWLPEIPLDVEGIISERYEK